MVGKGRKNTTIKGIGNVDAAIKKFEKLIDAPLHLFWAFPENWDKKTTPIVAFVSMTDDPEKQKTISAFDGKGNRLELSNHDATVAKERPVLVITFNERSSTDGRVKNGIKTTKGLDVNQQVAKQKDPKLQVFVSGGSSTVRLNSVTVPAVASNATLFMDELWWEGGPEWIYTFQVGGTVSGWGYWWPWTNHILGVGNFWSATTYSPNAVHSLIPPSAADQDFVTDAEFKYYEDDATPGQWDIFDDWWGFHYWRATSNGTGGAIIYTLPQPGSTVTRYDLNPNVTTVGNYTWQ